MAADGGAELRGAGSSLGAIARKPQGRFLGMPYSWSRPAREDVGKGVWEPDERRVFTPTDYGRGYTLNPAALPRRLNRR